MTHVVFSQLCDWAEGRLPVDDQATVAAHLATCARCAAELTWLQNTMGLMRTDTSVDAPRPVIERALRLFRPQPQPSLVQRLRQLVATVRFDSALAGPAFGVRAGASSIRQVVVEAEPWTLDLHATTGTDGWVVTGQVLGPAVAGRITLSNDVTTVHAELNALAEFALPIVPAGTYQLVAQLDQDELILPEFVLAA